MYYNARFYDPSIGRFLTADTIVPDPMDAQQFNRYAYVTNNPIKYTDPTGHYRESGVGGQEQKEKEKREHSSSRERKETVEKSERNREARIAHLDSKGLKTDWVTTTILGVLGAIGAKIGSMISAYKAYRELKYAERVRMRALQDPKAHNFPYSFDKEILSTKPVSSNKGYRVFQKEGYMNDKKGVFEIGVNKDGVIDHRFFRPN